MRYVLADPSLTHRTAGEEFARAVAGDDGEQVDVRVAATLPTLFPLAATRPRYTVRHLLKTAVVVQEPVSYVTEPRPPQALEHAGVRYADTPEATFGPRLTEAKLADVAAEVELPAGLVDDPALLAAFVDHRLLVRLCTAENEALLRGSADGAIEGLLSLSGLRRRPSSGPLAAELTRAAADVEEMGGSCDAIVVHPVRYWELVENGLLGRLGDVGVRVSRTRMIAPDQLLLGDFRAAVTLLDTGWSTLTLHRGEAGDRAVAAFRVGLAVHLPQHFLLLERA